MGSRDDGSRGPAEAVSGPTRPGPGQWGQGEEAGPGVEAQRGACVAGGRTVHMVTVPTLGQSWARPLGLQLPMSKEMKLAIVGDQRTRSG